MALYVLVEGPDDIRFFERILKPILSEKYGPVRLWAYSCQKYERILAFINSIESMKEQYLFVCDLDEAPCVTDRKQRIQQECSGKIPDRHVAVVVKEIESWYMAGATSKLATRRATPTALTKEQFARLIPDGMPRVQFMDIILSSFDLEMARKRNESLQYFVRKWADSD